MTVPPYAVAYVVTLAVSWSADYFNAFVPPLQAPSQLASLIKIQSRYAFCYLLIYWCYGFLSFRCPSCRRLSGEQFLIYAQHCKRIYVNISSPAPLWMLDCRYLGCILMHSSSSGLAVFQSPLNGWNWFGHCDEYFLRSAWSNRRCLDLQVQSSQERLPYWPLDQRSAPAACLFRMCFFETVLRVDEPAVAPRPDQICLLRYYNLFEYIPA